MRGTKSPQLDKSNSVESVRRVLEQAVEAEMAQDLDALRVLYANDCVIETAMGVYRGWSDVENFYRQYFLGVKDYHAEITTMVIEGSSVALEMIAGGLATGRVQTPEVDFVGTGRRFAARSTWFFQIEAGRIKSARGYVDRYDLLKQLGLLPEQIADVRAGSPPSLDSHDHEWGG